MLMSVQSEAWVEVARDGLMYACPLPICLNVLLFRELPWGRHCNPPGGAHYPNLHFFFKQHHFLFLLHLPQNFLVFLPMGESIINKKFCFFIPLKWTPKVPNTWHNRVHKVGRCSNKKKKKDRVLVTERAYKNKGSPSRPWLYSKCRSDLD